MIPYCILAIENDDDREFMTALYNEYEHLMFSTVRKIIKNESDVEDLVQDALERLIDKIPLLRSRSHAQLINYIISTCKNTALNYKRDHGNPKETSYEEYMELPDPYHDGHEVEIRLIKGDELDALRRILPQMDMRSQRLLEGYYYMNMPISELAKEFNVKPDSLRMLLSRARKKAFDLLQKEGIEGVL